MSYCYLAIDSSRTAGGGATETGSRGELIVEWTKLDERKEYIYSEIEGLSLPKVLLLVAGFFAFAGIAQNWAIM